MELTIGIIILILVLLFAIKITAWIFKLCGKLFGILLSVIGYVIIGGAGIAIIGAAAIVIPIVLIAAVFSIIRAIFR